MKSHCAVARRAATFLVLLLLVRVVGVIDGDTLKVLLGGKEIRVRIAEIDCPEKRQPFGKAAKEFTSRLAFGREVGLDDLGRDRYGRLLSHVTLPDGRDLGRELVGAGLAWQYRKYSTDPTLGRLESEARAARRGLWADPDPVPPWVARRRR